MKSIFNALAVLFGAKVAVKREVVKLINQIYKLVEPNKMNQDTKDKLNAVKAYLAGLPAKFQALQAQIDALKNDDDADAAKIAELTAEVDALKAEQGEIVTVADELDLAVKAADEADGPDA